MNFDIIETVSKDDIAGQISKQLKPAIRARTRIRHVPGQPEGHRRCRAALHVHRLQLDAN